MEAFPDAALQKQLLQDLSEINQAMSLGAEDVLSVIWRKGARLIGAEHGSIRLLRNVGGRPALVIEAWFGAGWTEEKQRRIMELDESISGAVAQSGRSRYCADVSQEPDYKGSFPEFRSKICVPIRLGDEIIGVMNFNSRAASTLGESHVRVAEIFASQTALAVNNVRLKRREERAGRALELSKAINEAINATLDLDEVMSTLLNKLDELGQATAVDVFIYDPVDRVLRNAYRLKKGDPGSIELGLGQGLIGAAAQSRRAINVGDVSKDARYLPARTSTRSELATPMIQCGELVGMINLESDRHDAFDEEDEQLLEGVAIAACIAIRNAREHEELRLTGRRIVEMEDHARFVLTTTIHDEIQKTVRRLSAEAHQQGNAGIVALSRELEQKVDRMRFDLSMPILPHNLRLELRQLVEEDLPQRYPAVSRLRRTLRLSALDDVEEIAPSVGVLTYRFVRGALANVYEHAQADRVWIEVERWGDTLILRVRDNGQGFDTSRIEQFIQAGHYFFHDIRIRAAQLGGAFHYHSRPGEGTALELQAPLVWPRPADSDPPDHTMLSASS